MKGLTLFITDIRRCKGKEEEIKRINKELAKIRSKFNGDKPLNGYHKKKYVCKLLFMFLLGHENDFGHMEAVNLLSSNAYSEKQIGYLFISVVMGNNHNFMPLVINCIKSDLSSQNKCFQNLALQFVANNVSKDIADSLTDRVLEMLLSSETVDFVQQSAALTLLQLLRFQTDLTFGEMEANRIINLISHHHLGVVTASASLIDFLAKTFPSQFQSCISHCILRLHKIANRKTLDFRDYSYCFITAPWLTIKLLRILQNFPAPTDTALKSRLKESLDLFLNKAHDPPKAKKFEHNNAKYAVIFEAISLIIQMELDAPILNRAISILGSALNQRAGNIRFMALDFMVQLSNNECCLASVKEQWKSVLKTLKNETDITLKKRALDLLHVICDTNNVKPIVNEMLYFLKVETDYASEIVLKAAALAEQFGKNSPWYVDAILTMLMLCGDTVDESIWYTLVNVITENNMMQEYAAKLSYAVLTQDNPCPDPVIKVAGYILGEFGYLIAKYTRSNHINQFKALRKKYGRCSSSARSLLLTTYMKFLSVYPDLKCEIQTIFREECNSRSANEEIQQRAVEYLKLSQIASKSLLAVVFEEMPFSTNGQSAVREAIQKQKIQMFEKQDAKRNLSVKHLTQYRSYCNLAFDPDVLENGRINMTRSVSHSDLQVVSNSSTNLDLLMNIFKEKSVTESSSEIQPSVSVPLPVPRITNVLTNETFLHNLLFNETGTLFENYVIKVLIGCEFSRHFGRLHLAYKNKSIFPICDFSITGNFRSIENKCTVWFKPTKSVLPANESMEQNIQLECLGEFSTKPSVTLKFTCMGEQSEMKLILPLTLNKFVEPSFMNQEVYNKRWQHLESIGHDVVNEFSANYPMIFGITRHKLKGFRVAVIENADSNNFNCAGIFHTRSRRIGFLINLERYLEDNKYRISVRSCQLELCQAISDLLVQLL